MAVLMTTAGPFGFGLGVAGVVRGRAVAEHEPRRPWPAHGQAAMAAAGGIAGHWARAGTYVRNEQGQDLGLAGAQPHNKRGG